MKKISLKTLVKKGLVTNISPLRINKNGFPYVTLLRGNSSNNLYFGKKTAEVVLGTFNVGDNIQQYLLDADVVEVPKDSRNEAQFKLVKSTSEYGSEGAFMEAFGIEEQVDFPITDFTKEFATKTAVVAVEEEVEEEA